MRNSKKEIFEELLNIVSEVRNKLQETNDNDIRKFILKLLSRYNIKLIEINGKKYPLYLVPEYMDEDINLFEGFLLVDAKNKSEESYFVNKYQTPVSGYAPRIGIIFYEDTLTIKDYRKYTVVKKSLSTIDNIFLNKLKNAITHPSEGTFDILLKG